MKNYILIIPFLFCNIFVIAQKKKKQTPPPPTIEKTMPIKTEEISVEKDIEYMSPPVPAPAEDKVYREPEKKIENLSLNPDAKKCACKDVAMILASDKRGEGITSKGWLLKGKVKSVKIIEKRDTLVGYESSLSRGNIKDLTFSEQGSLQSAVYENMGNQSKNNLKLKDKNLFFYNSKNLLESIKFYFSDSESPLGSYQFLYNEMGLSELKLNNEKDKTSHTKSTFNCSQTNNEYYVLKQEKNFQDSEENELLIFNKKNELLKKQTIVNVRQNTTSNRSTSYVYNDLGFVTEEKSLNKDGSVKSYVRHQYNDKGDLEKSVYDDGEYTVYEYKYDSQNNWIYKKETVFAKNRFSGEMKIDQRITWERSITYY